MAQLFLNNLETTFIAPVQSVALTGTPATELGYGILQISDGAAGVLINPTGGDYYVLTAFKRAGTVESNVEVMRVTAVDNATPGECRITVLRAQEGTTAQSYVSGDRLALRLTAGAVNNWVQGDDSRLTDSRTPTAHAHAIADVTGLQTALDGKGDVTATSTHTLTNKTIGGGVHTGVIDHTGSIRQGITAVAALDIDCSAGNYFTKTIAGNSTFTFSNAPSSRAYGFTMELTHTSGTVTWPASVVWPNGTAPTLTTGKVHLFFFVTDDGGTTWRGGSSTNYAS